MNVRSLAATSSPALAPYSSKLVGAFAGASLAAALYWLARVPLSDTWPLPVLGVLAGSLFDLHRRNADEREATAALRATLESLAHDTTHARGELSELRSSVSRIYAEMTASTVPATSRDAEVVGTVAVKALSDRLMRRATALTGGRDVRTSVFTTRDAPAAIRVDTALLDRVLDRLLLGAMDTDTTRSVVVELSGEQGCLVVKVSNTDGGLDAAEVERRMSIVADDETGGGATLLQLVARLHGRLEVLAKVGRGTSFWLHVPLDADAADRARSARTLKIRQPDGGPR